MGLVSQSSWNPMCCVGIYPPTWLATVKALPADTLSGEATPECHEPEAPGLGPSGHKEPQFKSRGMVKLPASANPLILLGLVPSL